jgi:hypothetical protein
MPKKSKEITIRSSAAEYLTYIAATGDNKQSFEMRYEDENIWLTQKMMAVLYDVGTPTSKSPFRWKQSSPMSRQSTESESGTSDTTSYVKRKAKNWSTSRCRFIQK